MIQKVIRQSLVSLLVFVAVLFAFSRVDWMELFGLHRSIIEERLGDVYWELFSQSETFIDDETLTASLDSLLSTLCRANGMERDEVSLHLVECDEVNAYACPGNHLVVYTALIDSCRNAEELCGVLAHELAHIERGHVMQKLIKEMGIAALAAMVGGNGGTETLAEVMRILSSTAYDRTLESEADRLAVDYLLRANVNPRPFGEFLLRLAEEEDLPSLAEWISTHPDSKKRSQLICDRADREAGKHAYLHLMTNDEWEAYRQAVSEKKEAHSDFD